MKEEKSAFELLCELQEEVLNPGSIFMLILAILDVLLPKLFMKVNNLCLSYDTTVDKVTNTIILKMLALVLSEAVTMIASILVWGITITLVVVTIMKVLIRKREKRIAKKFLKLKELIEELIQADELSPRMIFKIAMADISTISSNKSDVKAFKKYLVSTYTVFEPFDKETDKFGVFKDENEEKKNEKRRNK